MAVAAPAGALWQVRIEPVGTVATLLARLRDQAGGAPVALGLDLPIGLPQAYVRAHLRHLPDFPGFLDQLAQRPEFFQVCATLAEIGPHRPFYPQRPQAGMSRRAHAEALGLGQAAAFHRVCDRPTIDRPAAAPLFWTLGPNQAGKAALSAWQHLLLPARASPCPPAVWPFEGPLLSLLAPGRVAVAETYPAEALRQLGLAVPRSKRRQADRAALAPDLRAAMARLGAAPDPACATSIVDGFGTDPAGEDRFDCLLGLLGLLQVLRGERSDRAPDNGWIQRWEGWILGQDASSLPFRGVSVHS